MKASEITPTQFAYWSFERDLAEGCYDDREVIGVWGDLPPAEKRLYIDEANMYMNTMPTNNWPIDILERLEA